MYINNTNLSIHSHAWFHVFAGVMADHTSQHSLLMPSGYSTKNVLYLSQVSHAGTLPYARLNAKYE